MAAAWVFEASMWETERELDEGAEQRNWIGGTAAWLDWACSGVEVWVSRRAQVMAAARLRLDDWARW
ncbi:hypothetical protein M0R45_032482 [Rubus argutus]|uniref:Uncharacterized protein n=1 Tax=Rubus argutus TaxID=59490 RepID=A0AAW1WJH6_RUBAR